MTTDKFGHYRLVGKLGEGGMGVVYRAHDEQLQRDLALKLLPADSFSDETARARLVREARSAAALNHPNICTIFEVGEAEGQAYIAMELVEGQPLTGGRLPASQVVRYGVQLADALAHAHERGIIHRDLKSANIILTTGDRAKVLDFGLAKRQPGPGSADETATLPGTVVGTLAYMAPEQLRGESADARSDIWALGVVLYEMASGLRPFHGRTGFDLSSAILKEPPAPLPPDVRPELRAIIQCCLEKEPERRYRHASELRTALEALQSATGILPAASRPMPRRWVLAAAALVAVILFAVVFRLVTTHSAERRPIESLAVLPLENLSRDADEDFVVQGIHEALITDLAKLGGFRKVIARASVQRYRRSDKPLPQIARELGVEAVLTGSVMRSGDRVSITAQLTRLPTEENLWADRFEREFRDVLTVQSEIVAAITRAIKARLTTEQKVQLAGRRPVNPESHEAYLRGMFHVNKFTPEGFGKGLSYLQQAIDRDPANALAYGGLALAYSAIGHTPAAPPDALPKAKAAALKALELDPTLAEAHEALAEVKLYSDRDYDWAGAEKVFQRALELNPSLPQAHAHRGWYLLLFGRRTEALAEMRRAVELDPLNPLLSVWLAEHLMGLWFSYRDPAEFSQGMDLLQRTLELNPDFPVTWHDLGRGYAIQRRFKESIEAHQKANAIEHAWGWALGVAYALAGRTQDARKQAAELAKEERVWNTFAIAEIFASLGDKQEAFRWLEAAYQQRHSWTPWIGVNPSFAGLRGDPRFQDLLRRMKLPQDIYRASW